MAEDDNDDLPDETQPVQDNESTVQNAFSSDDHELENWSKGRPINIIVL